MAVTFEANILLSVVARTSDWLLTPMSGASEHYISAGTTWHGRLMVLAWAILMPAAFVVARFYKITPGQDWPRRLDNPFWFVNHRRLGYAILIQTIVAVGVLVWSRGGAVLWHGHHAIAGWTVSAFALFQVIGALLRGSHGGPIHPFTRQARPPEQWPGDHFSLTQRRIFFEYSHKFVGYVLVVLAAWAIASGLHAADAPRWMWLLIGVWTLLCIGAFVHLQCSGKCIDTYQAIWGLDETLPGYRRKPIGWGIIRIGRKSDDET
jgi:hypothetical protein